MARLLTMLLAIFATVFFMLLVLLPVFALAHYIARHLEISVTDVIQMAATVMAEYTGEFILSIIAMLLQKASSLLQWMIEYLTDAVRHVRSPVDIDHAVAAMQIPLSLIDAIGESASVDVVGTAIMSTIESVLQCATDAIYDVQLMPHIVKTIGGCIIFIAIALASWWFMVARARRAAEPSPASPLPTPLGSPPGQGSMSPQRPHHPLSSHPPGPWAESSDLQQRPDRPADKSFKPLAKLSGHGTPSDVPPQPYAEVPGSPRFLNPTSNGARLRNSINLPLDTETWCQELEEMERRILKAQARLSSPETGHAK